MKRLQKFVLTVFILNSVLTFAQTKPEGNKLNVTGKVIEKSTNLPLEYSTITLKNTSNPSLVFGGITNNKGEFSIQVAKGTYDIIIEFISNSFSF